MLAVVVQVLGLNAVCAAWACPDQVASAWDEALAADGPVLVEAITDPEVPPLPPHIRFEQAKEMAMAMAKGDPNRGHIIRESLKGKLAEFVNR